MVRTCDLVLKPTNPVSSHYTISALSPRGAAFLNSHLRNAHSVSTGRDMRNFREACARMELTFETDWSCALQAREALP